MKNNTGVPVDETHGIILTIVTLEEALETTATFLTLVVSLEAISFSTFILIRQNHETKEPD